MEFSKQEYWSGLPFPSPVDHAVSEVSKMIRLSWVALHGIAHSFIELDNANMDTIKDRNGMDLTEAEDIKKRWQEYTEEL